MTTTWPLLDPADILNKLHRCGPDRVVVDRDGYGVPSSRARAEWCITPDIVFVRRDGWTCGAPKQFEDVAYRLYADEWVAFILRTGPVTVRSIADYKPSL